jgi:hypothetical protein
MVKVRLSLHHAMTYLSAEVKNAVQNMVPLDEGKQVMLLWLVYSQRHSCQQLFNMKRELVLSLDMAANGKILSLPEIETQPSSLQLITSASEA